MFLCIKLNSTLHLKLLFQNESFDVGESQNSHNIKGNQIMLILVWEPSSKKENLFNFFGTDVAYERH